jgi:selenocysteine lyase/cysteine desulfurase
MKRRDFLVTAGASAAALGGVPRVGSGFSRIPSGSGPAASLDVLARARQQPGPLDDRFWRLVRGQFPLPHDFAYLNTAGLGSSPFSVTNTVKAMMDREEAAPSPGHSEEDWARIRAKCAALLGPSCTADEIALVSTATEGINVILNGLPLGRGDEVITSTHEHVALAIPLLQKARTAGIVVRTFEPRLDRAQANVELIEGLMTKRTRLVFLSHVTCTTGQVFPVAEIGRLAAARGAWFALDGAQSLAHVPFDLLQAGADFYTASAHKWLLGPKRTGVLYVRKERLELLQPTVLGAYSDASNSLAAGTLTLRPNAQRFEYGTQNDALIYGLEAAVDFLAAIGAADAWEHSRALTERCAEGLRAVRGVERLWPAEAAARSAMVTFRVPGRDNRQVANALAGQRLRVRSVTEAGLDHVRASFHVCNSAEEVDRLVAAVRKLAGTQA